MCRSGSGSCWHCLLRRGHCNQPLSWGAREGPDAQGRCPAGPSISVLALCGTSKKRYSDYFTLPAFDLKSRAEAAPFLSLIPYVASFCLEPNCCKLPSSFQKRARVHLARTPPSEENKINVRGLPRTRADSQELRVAAGRSCTFPQNTSPSL